MSKLSTTSLMIWLTTALTLLSSLTYAIDLQQPVDPLAFLQNISQAETDMTSITLNSTSQSWASAYPQLVLFGDSITQGSHSTLMPKLIEAYNRRLDVINRGFSGYNALHAVPILPLIFQDHPGPHHPRVALMTVFFG
jgi:hypothetical protein